MHAAYVFLSVYGDGLRTRKSVTGLIDVSSLQAEIIMDISSKIFKGR